MDSKNLKVKSKNSLDTKMKKINCLKEDILREIFHYLSVMEKIRASFVCKKWSQIINGSWESLNIDEKIQKEFTKNDNDRQKFLPFVQKFLKNYGSNLTTISLTVKFNSNLDYLGVLKEIEKSCKNLTKLILIDYTKEKNIFTDKNIAPLFRNNVRLNKIYLKNININGNCLSMLQPKLIEELTIKSSNIKSKHLFNFLQQMENVKIINYSLAQYNNDEYMNKVIEALNKSGCKDILEFNVSNKGQINGLSEIISRQKKIQKLKLKDEIVVDKVLLDNLSKENLEVLEMEFRGHELGHYSLSKFKNLKVLQCAVDVLTQDFMKGLTQCKNLKKLDIFVYNHYHDNDLEKIGFSYFSQLLKLVSFKIYFHCEEVDKVLKALSRLKHLTNLNFQECKFTGMGFNSLYPKSFRNLKNLNVGSTNITDKELLDLIKKSPKLEKIDISCCKKITNKLVEAANKIKKDRQDRHVLLLNVHQNDEIYKLKESSNDSSLIMIEIENSSNYDMSDFKQINKESSSSEIMDFVNNFAEVYFNFSLDREKIAQK